MVIHASSGDEPGLIDVDFDDFYRRGYRRCVALGFVLTGSAIDADDLVQEAFSTAYRRWSEIANYDDPLAWVRKVMINNAQVVQADVKASNGVIHVINTVLIPPAK